MGRLTWIETARRQRDVLAGLLAKAAKENE
jgi:hypothetical protein